MNCEQSGCDGRMIATGEAFMSLPPKYFHVCNSCHCTGFFGEMYGTKEEVASMKTWFKQECISKGYSQ